MHDHSFASQTIETEAGEYQVRWYTDDSAEQPHDEGFTLAVNGSDPYGYSDRIDIEHGDAPPWVWDVLRTSGRHRQDSWEYELRSGAALVRYLTLKGFKGVTLVTGDYYPVEASADRSERVHGVAWAPDDVTDPTEYVKSALEPWRSWASGDVFGWELTGPGGDNVDGCWGFYGFHREMELTLAEARHAAEYDAAQRTELAGQVGAGFVGII